MKLQLADELSSTQDLRAAILQVREYAKWVGQADVQSKVSGGVATEQPVVSAATADLIKQIQSQGQPTRQSLDELVEALEDIHASAPRISITLAAPAPTKLKKAIVNWCRQQINPAILVDFQFNSLMLGGMVVNYDSHLHDWSFRSLILAAKDKFPETLRNA